MIKENTVGKLRSNCWAIFKKDHDEWLRHSLGKLWKKPPSSSRNLFKMCLMGILMGSFRTYSQFAHWSSCDQSDGLFSKKFKIGPLGIWWVNCLKDQKKITICPLGFCPSAPSDCERYISEESGAKMTKVLVSWLARLDTQADQGWRSLTINFIGLKHESHDLKDTLVTSPPTWVLGLDVALMSVEVPFYQTGLGPRGKLDGMRGTHRSTSMKKGRKSSSKVNQTFVSSSVVPMDSWVTYGVGQVALRVSQCWVTAWFFHNDNSKHQFHLLQGHLCFSSSFRPLVDGANFEKSVWVLYCR